MRYLGSNEAVKSTLASAEAAQWPSVTLVDAEQTGEILPERIVVGSGLEPADLLSLLVKQRARTVLQPENRDFARQVAFCGQITAHAEEFFKNPEPFLFGRPTGSLLGPTLSLKTYRLNEWPHKDAILADLQTQLEAIIRAGSLRDSAMTVAGELVMNIQRDAPLYFAKSFPELSLHGRSGQLLFAQDGERLLLCAIDDYGSMNVDKMLERLQECYLKEQSSDLTPLQKQDEGAGLGCKLILDSSVSMSVLVKPRHKTVFCALLPVRMSQRQAAAMPKNVQVLTLSF